MSEDQDYCAAMLAEWACGKHHLPDVHEFGRGVCINFYGDLATYDTDRLTRLVLLAHRDAIRVEIASSGPRRVKIIAHRRKHGARTEMPQWGWHPGMEDLEKAIAKMQPATVEDAK